MALDYQHTALTEGVYYILLALSKPLHGYGIMQWVREVTDNRVNLAPGTLYGALNTLLERGWIEALENAEENNRKEYRLTKSGSQVLKQEILRLKELLENGQRIVEGSGE